jgi:hypothetical protein
MTIPSLDPGWKYTNVDLSEHTRQDADWIASGSSKVIFSPALEHWNLANYTI